MQKDFFGTISFKLHPSQIDTASLPEAQTLYNWLVRPIANDLKTQNVNTLIFVPDKFLRSLPMAILHDGENYLIDHLATHGQFSSSPEKTFYLPGTSALTYKS